MRLLFHLVFWGTTTAFSQKTITSADILTSALRDRAVDLQAKKIERLRALSYRLPWVEDVGLRTGTDQFDFAQQNFSLRMNVNGMAEIRAQKSIHQNVLALELAEKGVLLERALLVRYEQLAEFWHIENAAFIQKKLRDVQADKMEVLRELARTSADLDLDYLIKSEDEMHQIDQNLLDFEQKRLNIRHLVADGLGLREGWRLDSADRISINDLRFIVAHLPEKKAIASPLVARQTAEVQFRKAERELEKAKARKVLDFFQTSYSADRDEPFRNEFSVGLGLLFPYRGSSKIKLNDLFIGHLEEAVRREDLAAQLADELRRERERFELLFRQRDLVLHQLFESNALFAFAEISKVQGSSPLALLRLQENLLKRTLQSAEIERQIVLAYLRILELSGKISEPPLRNWLSDRQASLPVFESNR